MVVNLVPITMKQCIAIYAIKKYIMIIEYQLIMDLNVKNVIMDVIDVQFIMKY